MPVKVHLLALPESTLSALHGALEVLLSVGVAWRELTGQEAPARRMEARIVARDTLPFRSPFGPPIAPEKSLAEAGRADVVIVTDLALSEDIRPDAWEEEIAWLRRQADEGALLCSVCTGSVLFAEAGLLDGVEATTHWSAVDIFRERYPRVRLRPERILCPAGDAHRIITSGGVASWTDLVLHLIVRFCGEEEAVRVAKVFLLGDRSEGQLVFSAMGQPKAHQDAVIGECQTWIAEHYAAANPVARMVRRSGLATRTFKRRFKAATGYTPVDYVQTLRIEEAKQLLETSHDSTEEIALAVGYEDPAFFRRLFKRRTGVTPARYRQRYRCLLAPEAGGGRLSPAASPQPALR